MHTLTRGCQDPPPYSSVTEVVEPLARPSTPNRPPLKRRNRQSELDLQSTWQKPPHYSDVSELEQRFSEMSLDGYNDELFEDLEAFINDTTSSFDPPSDSFLITPIKLPELWKTKEVPVCPVKPPRVLYGGVYATIYEHISKSQPSQAHVRRWDILQRADRLRDGSRRRIIPGCRWTGPGTSPLRASFSLQDIKENSNSDTSNDENPLRMSLSSDFSKKLARQVNDVWSRIANEREDRFEEEAFVYDGVHTEKIDHYDLPQRPSTPLPEFWQDTTHVESATLSLYDEIRLFEEEYWQDDYSYGGSHKIRDYEVERMLDISSPV